MHNEITVRNFHEMNIYPLNGDNQTTYAVCGASCGENLIFLVHKLMKWSSFCTVEHLIQPWYWVIISDLAKLDSTDWPYSPWDYSLSLSNQWGNGMRRGLERIDRIERTWRSGKYEQNLFEIKIK